MLLAFHKKVRVTHVVITLLLCLTLCQGYGRSVEPAFQNETIVIDTRAQSHAFPHFWEQMFGSGRAVLSLRDSYRSDLRAVKKITGFKYVRFHAIFQDELGVYDEDAQGQPV